MSDVRQVVLSVRMSRDERKMLRKLSNRKGCSASDIVRMLVRDAHLELLKVTAL